MSRRPTSARKRWAHRRGFRVGFIFGPAIGGTLAKHVSLSAPFYFAAALAFLNALFIAARLPETHGPEHRLQPHEQARISDVFGDGRGVSIGTIFAAYFFSIAGFSMMTTLFALYNEKRFEYDAAHTGYLLAYMGALGVVIQGGLLRRLLKKPIEKQIAVAGAGILAVSLYAMTLCHTLSALLLVSAGVALGNGLVTPTLNGLASRISNRRVQGRTMGLLQSCGSLGRVVGPVLGTWLLRFDPSSAAHDYARTPFWMSAALLVVTMVLVASTSPPEIAASADAVVPEV